MTVFRPLYDKVLAWSRHPLAERYLGAMSFAESSFFPIPVDVMQRVDVWAPPRLLRPLMDWLFRQRFMPEPPFRSRPGAGLARWLLYIRAHWLRMPPAMLVRHLTVKALRRARESRGHASGDQGP